MCKEIMPDFIKSVFRDMQLFPLEWIFSPIRADFLSP